MRGPWYVDLHQASARGTALQSLVRIRCSHPFDPGTFYAVADHNLRARRVTYADLAAILNQRDESIVRMRIRDRRPPRVPA
jgi:hypothetical protein